MRWRLASLPLILLLPAAARADGPPASAPADPPADPPAASAPASGWSGKGQFGFLASQGNARAQSANAALDAAYLTGSWKHTLHADLLYGQSAGIVSAERWDVLWQTNRQIDKQLYAFGAARYERDLFDGFQYQGSGTAGIGYQVFDTKTIKLSTQLGAGYMLSRPEQLITPFPVPPNTPVLGFTARKLLPREDYAIATAGIDYQQQLTSTTSVSDRFLADAGVPNTLITNLLSLAVKVSTKLALSLGYEIQDNSHPPPGVGGIDTTETVNLQYSF